MPEDCAKCKSFTIISNDSLLVYENKYYVQVYSDNCAYKILNTHDRWSWWQFFWGQYKLNLKIIYYNKIDSGEGIDVAKNDTS